MNVRLPALLLALLMLGTAAADATAQTLRAARELNLSTLRSLPGVVRPADHIVALVNSEPITNNEVRLATVRAEQQITQRGAAMPPREELLRQVLERMISERVQVQAAREAGIRIDESAIDQAADAVARQNGLPTAEFRRRIEADGMSWTRFRNDLRDELLMQRVREREVEPRVRISELDVDQFIREQQEGVDPAALEINIAQVLVAVPESANEAQVNALRARAQRVYERARAGEDFAALARDMSDAPERRAGGEFGLRPADRYPQLFVDAVARLRQGEVAQPVRSGAGFHVLKLVEKRQAGLPGVRVTQTRARHILLRTSAQLSELAALERMAEIRNRIRAGEDFAVLARQFSQDATAREGGDLGWTNPGVFVPEFEEVMNGLAPRDLSQPFVSRFGVHLLQVLERRDTELSQREQREIARNLLRERKLDEAYGQWVQELRGRAYVEYRQSAD